MNAVHCNLEFATDRYDYLQKQMPFGKIAIFKLSEWGQPWGFGRDNKKVANTLFKEALIAIGCDYDEDEINIDDGGWIDDSLFIVLKDSNNIGIVYVEEETDLFPDLVRDLMNHIINKSSILSLTTPEPKKPDNLVINKLKLFK